jgi:hypothetical protein
MQEKAEKIANDFLQDDDRFDKFREQLVSVYENIVYEVEQNPPMDLQELKIDMETEDGRNELSFVIDSAVKIIFDELQGGMFVD